MATQSGRLAKVEYNGNKVAGMGTWTLGGFTRETIEEDSWDLDIKKKYFSVGDGGTISFSGLYDAADPNGQQMIDSCCLNSSLTGITLRFYVNAANYWKPVAGSDILITKCQSITMEKSAMGTIDFEGMMTGGELEYI